MIWFVPYRFDYPVGVSDSEQRLVSAFQKHGLKHSIQQSTVKVEKTLGLLFHNSWNPIFVARLQTDGARSYLRGYFRVHWYTMVFSVFFLGMLLYQLWEAFQQPENQPGKIPGWRAKEIEFMLTFIAAFFGITVLGWMFGLPNARRILTALRESAAAQQGVPADRPHPAGSTGEAISEWSRIQKLFATVVIAIAVFSLGLTVIGTFTEEWTSHCGVEGHWVKKYGNLHECFADAELHLKQTGHASGCKRSDWPMVTLERFWGFWRN